jgi:DNA-binding NarL/FixJ family response regulator
MSTEPLRPLSPRQSQVVTLALSGISYDAIARQLGVTKSTVVSCLGVAYRRHGVHSLAALRKAMAK